MSHTYTSVLVHAVFATAHRRRLIHDGPRLHAYLAGVLRNLDVHVIAIGGMPDHVHLLMAVPPSRSIAEVLRVTKGNSSRWLNEIGGGGFDWQRGYGAFSVSARDRERIERYLRNQEQHHRTRSFEEEYRLLLEASGISVDERFLWT